jgi:cardiolipin synthase (CMP-forming)
MNLPNSLTLLRILLIPVFVIMIMDKLYGWALITFAVAGVTDGLDGLIARITHQRTELGAYLDPIADKLLLTAAFVTLAIIDIIPNWLTVIVITRDLIILLGVFVLNLTNHRPKIRPTLVSKVTTGFQISVILLVLLAGYNPAFSLLSDIAIYGATLFTILSGAHYIYFGTRMLNGKKPDGGTPHVSHC